MSGLAVLLATLIVVVPGALATLALYPPGKVSLPGRLALVFVLGSCVGGAIAFTLAVLHVLYAAPFFILLALASLAMWAAGRRRGSLAAHRAAVAADVRADPWSMAAGLLVLAAIAVFRLSFPNVLHFGFSTSWRYWADAVEIADAHRIPAQSLQYGMLLTPTVNKVFLNTLSAGISFAIGREALPGLGALLWLGSVGLAVVLWGLARELGLRLTAAAVPLFLLTNKLFLNPELTADLATYKAEIFGRMVAFGALLLAVRAVRDRGRLWEAVAAGAVFAVAFGIHLVPVLVAASLLVWYGVGTVLAERMRRSAAGVALRVAVIGGVGLAAGVLVLVLPHGDLGFRGPGRSETVAQFGSGFDPTRYLNAGQAPGQGKPATPHRWYIGPGRSIAAYTASATGLQGAPASGLAATALRVLRLLLPLGGLVGAVVMLLLFPRPLRPLGLAAWGLALALVALTWFFSTRYRLFIPAWFGIRRLFDYSSIPLVLLGLGLAEGLLVLLSRVGATAVAVVMLALSLVAAGVLLPGARVEAERVRADRSLMEGFDWIRANVACDARILANQHTEGVFEALTGRVALLEGVTPYLRPDILLPILRTLLDARAFFHDPAAGQDFLARRGVDYVVLLRAGAVGYREPIGRTDLAGIRAASFLRPVHITPAMEIYRVLPGVAGRLAAPRFPDPAGFPGYDCERDPIAA